MYESESTRPSLLIRMRDRQDPAAWSQFVDAYSPFVYAILPRNAYLMTYKNGQWDGQVATNATPGTMPLAKEWPLPWNDVRRQKFKIEGLDRPELFFVATYIAIDDTYPKSTLILSRNDSCRSSEYRRLREFAYTLATTAIVEGKQLSLTPKAGGEGIDATTEYPKEDLPHLADLAKTWIKNTIGPIPRTAELAASKVNWPRDNFSTAWSAWIATRTSIPSRISSASIRKGIANISPRP